MYYECPFFDYHAFPLSQPSSQAQHNSFCFWGDWNALIFGIHVQKWKIPFAPTIQCPCIIIYVIGILYLFYRWRTQGRLIVCNVTNNEWWGWDSVSYLSLKLVGFFFFKYSLFKVFWLCSKVIQLYTHMYIFSFRFFFNVSHCKMLKEFPVLYSQS